MADTQTISVEKIIYDAVKGELDIPEFQREFVWTNNQVKELFDSLIKGYPIGSFLIWDMTDYISGKHILEDKSKEWIVDGQQRIVSLCILTQNKPYWLDNTTWSTLLSKYKIKFNVENLQVSLEYGGIANNPLWIYPHQAFRCRNNDQLKELATELARYKDRDNFTDAYSIIYSNLKKVYDILKLPLPLIKVNATLEEIATIFERINSKGTRIKQADITLSYIAAYNEGWVRTNFIPYLEYLDDEGFYLEPTLLIRAITSVGDDKAKLKDVSDEFLMNRDKILDKAFNRLKESMYFLISNFKKHGILTTELIYAKNTLIPLIYLIARFKNDSNFDFARAFHYFILALAEGRYTGSSETILQEDINKIKSSENFDMAIKKLHEGVEPLDLSFEHIRSMLHYQGEARALKLVMYIIAFRAGAKDWFTRTHLGYLPTNEINKEFTIEEHHFFPKSLLKSIGKTKDEYDLLANISFVNPGTNKKLRTEPYVYIKKYNIPKEELDKQLIPTNNEDLWLLKNFDAFINERADLLHKKFENFFKGLYIDFY
ncbi:MAG: hypothetical protein KatS3mg003_1620 [Candidatus Nitrosocaldaceae archaeon]|nr:MAG: hypothetical protein KatS3mg003_1620 [Candidatus Nitrosocaldaceae archaeon]